MNELTRRRIVEKLPVGYWFEMNPHMRGGAYLVRGGEGQIVLIADSLIALSRAIDVWLNQRPAKWSWTERRG